MNVSRPSLEIQLEDGKAVQAAKALQARFQNANLHFLNKASELNSHKMDSDEELNLTDDVKNKDPAIVAAEVAAQMVYACLSYLLEIIQLFFARHILGS